MLYLERIIQHGFTYILNKLTMTDTTDLCRQEILINNNTTNPLLLNVTHKPNQSVMKLQ